MNWFATGVIGAVLSGAPSQAETALLNHIVGVFEENCRAFRFGRFRMAISEGSAPSDEDAMAGRFSSRFDLQARFLFDGDKRLYEKVASEEVLRRTTRRVSESQFLSTITLFRLLADSRICLTDIISSDPRGNGLMHSAQVVADADAEMETVFPLPIGGLDKGMPDFTRSIRRLLEGKLSLLKLDADAQFEGRPAVLMVVGGAGGRAEYYIDLERGAVPLHDRSVKEGDKVLFERKWDDIRSEPGGGWLPRTMTESLVGGKRVIRITVTDANVTERPPDADFVMSFSRPIRLVDRTRDVLHTTPREHWRLADLHGGRSDETRPLQLGYRPETPVKQGEAPPAPWWWTAAAVAGGLGLILSLGRIFQLRRRG